MSTQKTILVVDDNLLMLKVLEKAFLNSGYIVFTADSADDALKLASTKKPAIILSDYEMPEKNGFYLREQLLLSTATQSIPFLFLTAHHSRHLMVEGLNLKAIDYITKDTPIEVIVAKVNNVFNTVAEQYQVSINEVKVAAAALNFKSFPTNIAAIPGIETNCYYQPYDNFPGGDFIDVITISQKQTFFIVGDVMGKKWKAWFFAFGILSYIRSAIRICVLDGITEPAIIMQKINHVICADETLQDILCTLSIVVHNHQTNTLHYCGAGDLPIIHYKPFTNVAATIHADGWLLGLSTKAKYQSVTIAWSKGDSLAIFTDGMIDVETNDVKKSDYESFKTKWIQLLQQNTEIKPVFDALKTTKFVDDASLLYLLNTHEQ